MKSVNLFMFRSDLTEYFYSIFLISRKYFKNYKWIHIAILRVLNPSRRSYEISKLKQKCQLLIVSKITAIKCNISAKIVTLKHKLLISRSTLFGSFSFYIYPLVC